MFRRLDSVEARVEQLQNRRPNAPDVSNLVPEGVPGHHPREQGVPLEQLYTTVTSLQEQIGECLLLASRITSVEDALTKGIGKSETNSTSSIDLGSTSITWEIPSNLHDVFATAPLTPNIPLTDVLTDLLRRTKFINDRGNVLCDWSLRVTQLEQEVKFLHEEVVQSGRCKETPPNGPSRSCSVVYPSPRSSFRPIDQFAFVSRPKDDDSASFMSEDIVDKPKIHASAHQAVLQIRGEHGQLQQALQQTTNQERHDLLSMLGELQTKYAQLLTHWQEAEHKIGQVSSKVCALSKAQSNHQTALQLARSEHSGQVQQLQAGLTEVANKCILSEQREQEYSGRLADCKQLGKMCRERLSIINTAVTSYFQSIERRVNSNF